MNHSNTHLCEKGCGRPVSGNKKWCMECIEEAAHAGIQAREEEVQAGSTHVIMQIPSQHQEDLYRADGMLVASRQGDIVRFGHDISTAQNRPFLNEDLAAIWLRKLADVDLVAQAQGVHLHEVANTYASMEHKAFIEERNAERRIVLAAPLRLT